MNIIEYISPEKNAWVCDRPIFACLSYTISSNYRLLEFMSKLIIVFHII